MATINDEPMAITRKGLDAMYDIVEHLCLGGAVTNHPTIDEETCAILLGVMLNRLTYEVNAAEEINE